VYGKVSTDRHNKLVRVMNIHKVIQNALSGRQLTYWAAWKVYWLWFSQANKAFEIDPAVCWTKSGTFND